MKIFGVGMNYIQHNKELDGALYKPEEPVIFTKADSALLKDHKPFFIPDWSSRVDYEAELVVRICRLGKGIPVRFAHRYYDALTVGIDFTARDLQRRLKDNGHPWEIAKAFDGSAALGEWRTIPCQEPSSDLLKEEGVEALASSDPAAKAQEEPSLKKGWDGLRNGLSFHLDINGKTVQTGNTADMLYKVDELISYISRFFTLKTGDMLYTGTPVGVGPVHVDDHLEGYLEGEKLLDFWVR